MAKGSDDAKTNVGRTHVLGASDGAPADLGDAMNARRNLQADMASSGERSPIYLTPTRRALLRGVANLEISLDETGAYRWLGNRRVNSSLYELEAQGWIALAPGGAPAITMDGSLALLEAEADAAR